MKKSLLIWSLALVIAATATPLWAAQSLEDFCDDWKVACNRPVFSCAGTAESAGSWGLEVDVFERAPGNAPGGEGELQLTNNNPGIWLRVNWGMGKSLDNLLFENVSGPASCPGSANCDCLSTTCPGPGADLAGCEIMTSCEHCECEVPSGTGQVLSPESSFSDGLRCALPAGIGQPCDNPDPLDPDFCVEWDSPQAFNLDVTGISFDGDTCFLQPLLPPLFPDPPVTITNACE